MTKPYKKTSGGILEHRVIAARALGKLLPPKAVVHHSDGNSMNNHQNLVICEDQGYHLLLDKRRRALKFFGNPNAEICNYCKQYDMPPNITVRPERKGAYHKSCRAKYVRELKWKKQEARRQAWNAGQSN